MTRLDLMSILRGIAEEHDIDIDGEEEHEESSLDLNASVPPLPIRNVSKPTTKPSSSPKWNQPSNKPKSNGLPKRDPFRGG